MYLIVVNVPSERSMCIFVCGLLQLVFSLVYDDDTMDSMVLPPLMVTDTARKFLVLVPRGGLAEDDDDVVGPCSRV